MVILRNRSVIYFSGILALWDERVLPGWNAKGGEGLIRPVLCIYCLWNLEVNQKCFTFLKTIKKTAREQKLRPDNLEEWSG